MAVLPSACTAPLQHSYLSSSPLSSATSAFLKTRVRIPYSFLPRHNRFQNAPRRFILRVSSTPTSYTVSEVETLTEVESVTISQESKPQEEPISDDGGGGGGDGDNFSGGGGGGDDNSGGGGGGNEEEPEEDPGKGKIMALSMSQKLTLGYAALVGMGGLMGFVKSGSAKSLISGGLSALVLYYVHSQLPTSPVFASSLGLGISAVLLIVMGARFKNSGKVFPAGVVSLVSLVMSGGYIHGILRSSHA